MKVIVKRVYSDGNKANLMDIGLEDIRVDEECAVAIDGSTDNTGLAVLGKESKVLFASMSFKRDKDTENPVKYKVKLKNELYKLFSNNKSITTVFYEEPFVGHISAVKNLFMLRTCVEELKYENEPELDYLKLFEINNLHWKKDFLDPVKCPSGTENQKKVVRNKLVGAIPCLIKVSQDEVDAISMGFTALKYEYDKEEKKVKPREFKYNAEFIGADDDEIVIQNLLSMDTIPDVVKEAGITFKTLNGIKAFDKQIYENMGTDDKLLILKFSSNKYGNIILKHRLGDIAREYEYIYALVWRKNRKK